MRLWFLLSCSLLAAAPAFANEWKYDTQSLNYILVDGKNALSVECYTQGPGQLPSLALHYWPACTAGCKGTVINDQKKLASVIVDTKTFATEIQGGDTENMKLQPTASTRDALFEALTTADSVAIYSSQVNPKYATFTNIKNPHVLKDYRATCDRAYAPQPSVLTPEP